MIIYLYISRAIKIAKNEHKKCARSFIYMGFEIILNNFMSIDISCLSPSISWPMGHFTNLLSKFISFAQHPI